MGKKYTIEMNLTQLTNGTADNITSTVEQSDDEASHLIKVKVFTEHLTKALDDITQDLCDRGLVALGKAGKPGRK